MGKWRVTYRDGTDKETDMDGGVVVAGILYGLQFREEVVKLERLPDPSVPEVPVDQRASERRYHAMQMRFNHALVRANLKESAMATANKVRERRGIPPAYDEDSFIAVLNEMDEEITAAKVEYNGKGA